MNKGDTAVRIKKVRDYFKKAGWYALGFRAFGNHSHEKRTFIWNKKSMMITQIWNCNRELYDFMINYPGTYHPKLSKIELEEKVGSGFMPGLFTLDETHSERIQIKNMYNTASTCAEVLSEITELFDVPFPSETIMKHLRYEMENHKNK